MKRLIAAAAAAVFAVLPAYAQGQAKTVKGEIVALSCYMSSPQGVKPDPNCTRSAISAGEPSGIVEDSTGELYVIVSPGNDQNEARTLVSYAGKTVEVSGSVQERQGLRTIAAGTVREAGSGQPQEGAQTGESPSGNESGGPGAGQEE